MLYRIKHPMDALVRANVPTKLIAINEDIEDTDMDKIKSFQFYGAYPFSVGRVLSFLKEKGKKIVYDCDDALALTDPTNPWYYNVMKDIGSVREVLSYADEVTVSVPFLADYMSKQTNAKITVLSNCYSQREWTFPRPKREGLRIGYAGSSSHVSDLIPILPIIKKLQDKYNFAFILFGFGSDLDYKKWYMDFRYSAHPQKAIKELEIFDKLLSEIKFEWVPFVEFEKYPTVLTNIALDIGLCPLKDTPFNRCRSACKAMEYTLSGALALASDSEAYRTDESSVLVKDDEWETELENYILFPEKRKEEHEAHLEWLRQNRNIDDKIDLLKEIYNE